MTSNTEPAFNLLDEPWVPVRTPTGTVDVSLTDALLKTSDYIGLAETSPPNLVALHRLLLAVLHRALSTHHGQWRDADRARWFREGLPDAPIRAYLAQWREQFWLFHPTHPFMQVAALTESDETRDKLKPQTQIALEGATGNTPIIFDHALDEAPKAISCALACRNLLGFLQFTPGGLVKAIRDSDKAGALGNTAAVFPEGDTLSETLLLGLQPWQTRQDDIPAWERPVPTLGDLHAAPSLASGPNDRYTRLSRAVLLSQDHSGQVSRLRFAAGIALEDDPNAPDSMACYRINKDGHAIRLSFAEGRALWRDLPSLVPDPGGGSAVPAAILGWGANLFAALGEWDTHIRVLSAGIASDQAKLLRWRAERVELPRAMLGDQDAAAELREQVRLAEDTYIRLRGLCVEMAALTMPDPRHKDTRARAKAIIINGPTAASYFSSAERALSTLMQQIADGDIGDAHERWTRALATATKDAWAATVCSLGNSPAVLRAEARTYPKLSHLLNSLVQPATDSASALRIASHE